MDMAQPMTTSMMMPESFVPTLDDGMAPETRARPQRTFEVKPGDWICPKEGCSNHNFARRTSCFRCNTPRPESAGEGGRYRGGYMGGDRRSAPRTPPRRQAEMRPGDWQCACGEHNFARRAECRRCNSMKPLHDDTTVPMPMSMPMGMPMYQQQPQSLQPLQPQE